MRDGKVICETLNLDSDAAQKVGLVLGSRLVSFEGKPIKTSNQFANLLSTYPAGWPAEFEFEVDGKIKKGVLRLGALSVNLAPPKPPMPRPMPVPMPEKPKEEAPKTPPSDKPEGEKPAPQTPDGKPPMPMPPMPPPPKPQPYEIVEPGEAMYEKVNVEFAKNAIAAWTRAYILHDNSSREMRTVVYEVGDASGAKLGVVKLTLHRDGKFEQTNELDGRPVEKIQFDGSGYTKSIGDGQATAIESHHVWQNPYAVPAWLFSAARRDAFYAEFSSVMHEGADKSDGRIASRLKLRDTKDRKAYLWIDAADLLATAQSYPSKFSLDAEGEDDVPALIFRSWESADYHMLPREILAVEGLNETPKWCMKLVEPDHL